MKQDICGWLLTRTAFCQTHREDNGKRSVLTRFQMLFSSRNVRGNGHKRFKANWSKFTMMTCAYFTKSVRRNPQHELMSRLIGFRRRLPNQKCCTTRNTHSLKIYRYLITVCKLHVSVFHVVLWKLLLLATWKTGRYETQTILGTSHGLNNGRTNGWASEWMNGEPNVRGRRCRGNGPVHRLGEKAKEEVLATRRKSATEKFF